MSKSLSLLLGGGGGGGGSGVIGLFVSVGLWSMEISFPLVVDSLSSYSRLMSTYAVNGPLRLFFHSSECSISSKSIFGRGATTSCVGKSKWILQREGAT